MPAENGPTGNSTVDLNSDLGEGFGIWSLGDDEALLDVVTSANVACGFHAGDPTIMRATCDRAARSGVVIGAQVSYRDLAGFGRQRMDVPPDRLADEITYQIGALDAFARAAGTRVAYVKPHGALYNTVVTDSVQAGGVAEGVRRYGSLPVLGLPGSALLSAAEAAGLPTVTEAFADRAYTPEGHLVSRREPGAVLHDASVIAARCVDLATHGRITAIDGSTVTVGARSICVHGDTPGAVEIARAVRAALEDAGIRPQAFAD
ncbi:LamB/YcsF family protein [Amycolatopsis sp. YIM 10]|uniref:LamB/YcsF family protein n=1 Tax=Amycolatopsis sp. YIM 10 TaxID=2653857 RepID=UPI00128FEAE0|nr:5-oxoprolinase subunit PxpA [Amycolatopsis sp. YIM 10]QFU94163.1 LamB/YcsF family protein [Amycolatopsis sp. YIM 10]